MFSVSYTFLSEPWGLAVTIYVGASFAYYYFSILAGY